MRTLCQVGDDGVCAQCGKQRKPGDRVNCPANSKVERPGRESNPQPQLGDIVEGFFGMLGITKERYLELKAELGFDSKTCGCNYRRELINGIGSKIGFDAAFSKFLNWRRGEVKGAPRPVTNN